MYYIRLSSEEEDQLIYYCRNCGNEDTTLTKNNICVSKTQLIKSEQKYNHLINEYTKLDPTLPRINTIKCPNGDCTSNHTKEGEDSENKREVIFLRYLLTNTAVILFLINVNNFFFLIAFSIAKVLCIQKIFFGNL